jgi:2-haloacid dehalogenase
MPVDTNALKIVSFDCYGTLIDWESGMVEAVHGVLRAHGINATPQAILQSHARSERVEEAKEYRSYRDVLRETMSQMAREFGLNASTAEQHALVESLPRCRPFPDAVPALRALRTRFRLGVLSNIDKDLFAATARHLGTEFDFVITAEDVRAYKPDPRHFRAMLAQTGASLEEHLHAAASLFHDVAPASLLGIPTALVRRAQMMRLDDDDKDARPRASIVVQDLEELARLLGCPGPGGAVYQ